MGEANDERERARRSEEHRGAFGERARDRRGSGREGRDAVEGRERREWALAVVERRALAVVDVDRFAALERQRERRQRDQRVDRESVEARAPGKYGRGDVY